MMEFYLNETIIRSAASVFFRLWLLAIICFFVSSLVEELFVLFLVYCYLLSGTFLQKIWKITLNKNGKENKWRLNFCLRRILIGEIFFSFSRARIRARAQRRDWINGPQLKLKLIKRAKTQPQVGWRNVGEMKHPDFWLYYYFGPT